ncbi:MAG: DUF11 domain-containing protein [Candidatus Brocadia sp.]|nr:DUF11 domain-containing protein [Candidatus Brocadia sp.]
MIGKNVKYKLLFFSGVMAFTLYGCGAFKYESGVGDGKPPHYHGHVEDEPPPRHTHMHEPEPPKGDMCVVDGAYPTNNKDCCSVIYLQKMAPCAGRVGQEYCYTIKATNLTKRKVKDVEVIQTLPKNFDVKSSDPEMGSGSGGGVAKWFLGELGPEETKEIHVCGIPTQSGNMPFCTDVTYKLPEICLDPVITEPKVAITKSAPSEVLLCDMIPMTFVVTNTGSGMVSNIKIQESLPEGLKTQDGRTDVELDVGSLNQGESKEVTLTVQAEKTGTFSNTATVVAEGGLTAESNTTTTTVKQPVLTIAKTGPDKVFMGRDISYDIEVKNEGDGVAAATIIDDAVPANTSVKSATEGATMSGSTVTWNLGALQPQDSRKVRVTFTPKAMGVVKNTATARANCADAVSASATTEVLGRPAILLEVVDIEDPIEVGSNVTYEITVTNQGSETGTNVKVACMLEDTMQYISSSGPTNATVSADGKTITFESLPTLASKKKATWSVVVKALSEGDARFKVTMSEDCLTRPVEETEATNFYE